ncbi:putative plant organelle RNA recognition domain-containing protein [Dioscorea sansibarensis]
MLLTRKLKRSLIVHPQSLLFYQNYVDVKMKWKKDPYFDTIPIINKSKELRPLLALKNIIAADPTGAIPISAVSKRARSLEISNRVASFLRKHPAVFEEFVGPKYNLPWFKLTQEAIDLDLEETSVFEACRLKIVDRLRRLVLMSREKVLPLRIVQGMLWYLGLPEDYLTREQENPSGNFQIVGLGDGEEGLKAVLDPSETVRSVLQRNALGQLAGSVEELPLVLPFPLFPSKGLRLKRKIEDWLDGFQNLERKLLCLKKHLGLPQKFHKVFERYPHVFYLLLKNKTCTVVLKEAYCAGSATAIEKHPMLSIRKKYVKLMNKSQEILRSRRSLKPMKPHFDEDVDRNVDGSAVEEDSEELFRDAEETMGV